MECNRFVEEKVGGSSTPEFRAHLAGCPGCARDVEELREVSSLYREASTEKYRGGVPKLRRFRMGWVPMAAAAAGLLVVFGFILAGPGLTPAPKPTTEADRSPSIYVRVHLAPWAADGRLDSSIDECWQ
jgi:hypothetical protein